jgi:2-polyprenyl-3-methyl-5-hydroxy-6-metoxy-1,4-benzoquinol methylase
MASSYSSQIPLIIHLLSKLKPDTVLDIGKGFGKYGFLLHEYCGVDNSVRPNPTLSLAQQSRIAIDAVESNSDYLWPHLDQLYRQIFLGRIETLYETLPRYDTILMADVIEHLEKHDALSIIRHFIQAGSSMIIATPRDFFQQELFESNDEHHVSHWTAKDFRPIASVDYQNADAGRVFLISPQPMDIRGFGRSPIKRLRRIARAVRNEL